MTDLLAFLLVVAIVSPSATAGWIARVEQELTIARALLQQKGHRKAVIRRAKAIRAIRQRKFSEART